MGPARRGCAGRFFLNSAEKIRAKEIAGKIKGARHSRRPLQLPAHLVSMTGVSKFSAGEGENEEIAFAGRTDGEEAAIGGDGEVAKGKPVENGNGSGLADGNVRI